MNPIKRAFNEHPASVGETWGEHAGVAFGFAWRLQLAALAALVHAVFPFLFVSTASSRIRELHARMVVHRVRGQAAAQDLRGGEAVCGPHGVSRIAAAVDKP